MTNKIIFNCLDEHVSSWLEYAEEELNIPYEELTYEEVFDVAAKGDFKDKGFTDREIQELYLRELSEHTAYKFMAYWIALFNQPDTFEEWKISAREDAELDLSDEELKILWDIRETEIDY